MDAVDERGDAAYWRTLFDAGMVMTVGGSTASLAYLLAVDRPHRRLLLLTTALTAVYAVVLRIVHRRRPLATMAARRRWFFVSGVALAPLALAGIHLDGGLASPMSLVLVAPAVLAAAAFPPRQAAWHIVPVVGGAFVLYVLDADRRVWSLVWLLGIGVSVVGPVLVLRGRTLRYAEAQEHLAARFEHESSIDGLTGLLNHRAFWLRVDAIVERAGAGSPVALIVLDIGDEVLRSVARTLASTARRGDLVGRLGGEEFGVVLVGLDAHAAREAGERLLAIVRQRPHASLAVTASGGLAWADAPVVARSLYARADALLYEAKRAGRDRLIVDDSGEAPPP